MTNPPNLKTETSQAIVYQIQLEGQLSHQWTDWFDGLNITFAANGDTVLTGPVVDQAALHGLIKKIRDLGLPLHSINQIPTNTK